MCNHIRNLEKVLQKTVKQIFLIIFFRTSFLFCGGPVVFKKMPFWLVSVLDLE